MTETKEFSEVKRKESIDEIEVWMSEQETLHPIREVLEKAYNEGFKAGQESVIKNYTPFPFDEAVKQARQDALEEFRPLMHLPELWRSIAKDHHPQHPCPEIVKCNRCLIVFKNFWVSAVNSYWEALEKEGEGK